MYSKQCTIFFARRFKEPEKRCYIAQNQKVTEIRGLVMVI